MLKFSWSQKLGKVWCKPAKISGRGCLKCGDQLGRCAPNTGWEWPEWWRSSRQLPPSSCNPTIPVPIHNPMSTTIVNIKVHRPSTSVCNTLAKFHNPEIPRNISRLSTRRHISRSQNTSFALLLLATYNHLFSPEYKPLRWRTIPLE
jgi:hypothetical protein